MGLARGSARAAPGGRNKKTRQQAGFSNRSLLLHFRRVRFTRIGYTQGREQLSLQSQKAVNREHFDKFRIDHIALGHKLFVLRIEHVEQRPAAQVKLVLVCFDGFLVGDCLC